MTPGFAKTRQELPWLYYPEADSVIINAHNFGGGGAFSPAVNGKMPIAAWIPSLDTAGNGTTTLTDLVGSNNGTLTNMDAATDWVADTDSGGVRALDFDGVNDYVALPSFAVATPYAVSIWIKPTSFSVDNRRVFGASPDSAVTAQTALRLITAGAIQMFVGGSWNTLATGISAGVWSHLFIVVSATDTTCWVDGVEKNTVLKTADIVDAFSLGGKFRTFDNNFLGRQDDIRIWDQALDATDAAALATGRGVNVA